MTDPQQQARLEALADTLSACADALHQRLMREIRSKGIAQGVAQALFENEVALRQRANSLYLDAAVLAASGLETQQQQLLQLTARAATIIERIDRIKDLVDLAGELVGVGAALASGKPEKMLSSLEKLKHHIEAM